MGEQWKKTPHVLLNKICMLPVVGQWAVRKLVLQLYFVIERKNLLKLVSSKSLHAPPATTEAFAVGIEVLQQQLAQEIKRR